jgi:hypothetical protein
MFRKRPRWPPAPQPNNPPAFLPAAEPWNHVCLEPTGDPSVFTFGMKKIELYRQHADECRMLASKASSPEHRLMLEEMAHTWESLAADEALGTPAHPHTRQ